MKLIHAFFVLAFLVVALVTVSAPVALADGVDPIVFTKGCGGTGQPACDAEILTPGNTTLTVTETFTCDLSGNCTASDTVINETGTVINAFGLVLDNLGGALTYSCGEGGLFTCTQTGATSFAFSGGTLCSDSDDFIEGTFVSDGDECGVVIGLSGTTAEGIFTGETVTGTFNTPEPSSALLLLFGFMGALASLKFLRNLPA